MVATDPFVTRSAEWRVSNDSEHRYRAPVPALSGPPSAPRRPTSRVLHGVEVVDDFAWMRQTDDPDLITYLRAENAWCDAATARLHGLIGQLVGRARRRACRTRTCRPRGGAAGGSTAPAVRPAPSTRCWCAGSRRAEPDAATPTTIELLDENALAVGHEFLELGVCEPSPDGALLAYSVDVDGDEIYTLRVRDLATGADLPDELTGTYAGLGWAADATSFLYTTAGRHVPAGHRAPARARHAAVGGRRGLARGGPAVRARDRADPQRRPGPAGRPQPGHLRGPAGGDRRAGPAAPAGGCPGAAAASTSSTTSQVPTADGCSSSPTWTRPSSG